jgi:hypothetical protein
MIVFQSSAIAESASDQPCNSPLPAGEGKGEGELFKLCAAYAHPPFLPKPLMSKANAFVDVVLTWRRRVVKKPFFAKRTYLLFAAWLFKAFQRDSKRFKPIQRFWEKNSFSIPWLIRLHGSPWIWEPRAPPDAFPVQPVSVASVSFRQSRRSPCEGGCSKICVNWRNSRKGTQNLQQPNLRDFKTL